MHLSRPWLMIAALAILLLCLPATLAAAQEMHVRGAPTVISLSTTVSEPVTITVKAGATVAFLNDTGQDRQVESLLQDRHLYLPALAQGFDPDPAGPGGPDSFPDADYWSSGPIAPGEQFVRVYPAMGNYPFYIAGVDALAGIIQVTAPHPFPPAQAGPPPITPVEPAPLAAGYGFTCALTHGGAVKCWGFNAFGQVGDGTTTNRSTPAAVQGLTVDIVSLTAGWGHACALTTHGAVSCWGRNDFGQLGDGTTTAHNVPVAVQGLDGGVVQIVAGHYHTCALTKAGLVKCWGQNDFGQLGDGTQVSRYAPVAAIGLVGAANGLAAGAQHTCAVTTDGEVACWGANESGQLGDGTNWQRATAGPVYNVDRTPLTSIAGLTAGWSHTCALTQAGGLLCWGSNALGELGTGTYTPAWAPAAVAGLGAGVVHVAATGGQTTCALTTAGGVQCWGNNVLGQVGDNSRVSRPTPVQVTNLDGGIAYIATGVGHACSRTVDERLNCWGGNAFGQLGDGTISEQSTVPVDLPTMNPIAAVALATGTWHSCAVLTTGAVMCWGSNAFDQLGIGIGGEQALPVVTTKIAGVQSLAAGEDHACAILAGGGVKCWGVNYHGALGYSPYVGGYPGKAMDVWGLSSGVAALSAGDNYTCALLAGGAVACWGYNYNGQIGDGTAGDRADRGIPVIVIPGGASAVSGGVYHTCALMNDGTALCWGDNFWGQLGDGTEVRHYTPQPVYNRDGSRLTGLVAIAAGDDHTCALTSAGAVVCWGSNRAGELGQGPWEYSVPGAVAVTGLSTGVKAITAGGQHTCALMETGTVKCWGYNGYGQLGNGTNSLPWNVVGVSDLENVEAVDSGDDHTCALTAARNVFCWGRNQSGQIGDGTKTDRWLPVQVKGLPNLP